MAVLDPDSIRDLCVPPVRLYGLTHAGRGEPYTRVVGLGRTERAWRIPSPLVYPYYERTRHNGKTFGLGPAGYDVRIAEDVWLWPFWGRLASTIERFNVPNDLTFLVQDKSSWARSFVFAMNTNGEPGWRGTLTLELVRFLPWPVRIRAGDPICNIMFLELKRPSQRPYEGKYQDQEPGPQRARYDALSTPRRRIRPWNFLSELWSRQSARL